MVEIGMQEEGAPFDPGDPLIQLQGDIKQPYRIVYEALPPGALSHYQSGVLPLLEISPKPVGAFPWGLRGQWQQGTEATELIWI